MSGEANTPVLPVLIIPGIMSSGLVVRKSAVDEKHVGDRVWLNPIALGFGKMYRGSAFKAPDAGSESDTDSDSGSSADGNGDDGRGDEPQARSRLRDRLTFNKHAGEANGEGEGGEDAQEELQCKSAWLQHLTLASDMCTEREGNEIRPIPGLDGVDFLTEIASINVGASYVFGPIIKLLCGRRGILRFSGKYAGCSYVKGVNLDACPYDWRVPPLVLEERDGYFTKTMERIVAMYADNDNTPVVLLCHSMGCKTGHYLLNFVLEKKGAAAGRQWLNKYVHTYMPLGAPHLGAPSLVASAFSASLNPMLDPMLSKEERLVFSRSLGSAGWLLPTTLPSVERNAPPAIFVKREGKLTIEILASEKDPLGDLRVLTTNKHGSREVRPFQVKIAYGGKKNRKKKRSGAAIPVFCHPPRPAEGCNNPQYFKIPSAKFIFPTPESLLDDSNNRTSLEPIQFTFYEEGNLRVCHLEPEDDWARRLNKINRDRGTALLIDSMARAKGGVYKINLAMSSPVTDIDVEKLVMSGQKGLTICVPVIARYDLSLRRKVPKKNPRTVNMKINVKWEPPPSNDEDDPTSQIAMMVEERLPSSPSLFASIPKIRSKEEEGADYAPLSGQAMFRAEGIGDTFDTLLRQKYNAAIDPVGPRHRSSGNRPPVKRTFAIYGVNLDTEVSKVCRRVAAYREDETPEEKQARPRFKVDTDTRLLDEENQRSTSGGHKLKDGTLLEHSGTPQTNMLTGERIFRSGDGTVPYYSLQQCQVWAKEVGEDGSASDGRDRVKIEEIDGAEHRAMLSDERFHKILVDYLTGQTVI